MALLERTTLRRDRMKYVNSAHVFAAVYRFFRKLRGPRRPHIADLPAHLRRDAGLTNQHLTQFDHRLPSQHMHHPRS